MSFYSNGEIATNYKPVDEDWLPHFDKDTENSRRFSGGRVSHPGNIYTPLLSLRPKLRMRRTPKQMRSLIPLKPNDH